MKIKIKNYNPNITVEFLEFSQYYRLDITQYKKYQYCVDDRFSNTIVICEDEDGFYGNPDNTTNMTIELINKPIDYQYRTDDKELTSFIFPKETSVAEKVTSYENN